MHRTVCLLSLGTDAYLEGGLARLRSWAKVERCEVTFVALDSLEDVNEQALGHRARTAVEFLRLVESVFQHGEYDFYLSSQLELDERYRSYFDAVSGAFLTHKSVQNLGRSQTYRSMHRRFAAIGVKNQRHAIVGQMSEYVVRELSLLAYLSSEFQVSQEISLHDEMKIRHRTEALLPSGMKFPRFVRVEGGGHVSDLILKNLVVPIGGGKRKLGPLNLTVRAGTILGVIGPNGVGKSTLLKTIGGHLKPTGGTIYLGDRDIGALPPIKKSVATVFQDSALFPDKSLNENIAIGERVAATRNRERLDYSDQFLEIFDLAERGSTRAARLSGGEQQLGAIARALAARPNVLLLDEPGASIDQIRKRRALALIKEFVQQTGTVGILVTHDPELIFSVCDSLLVLSNSGKQLRCDRTANFVSGGGSMTAAELIGLPNLFRCTKLKSGRYLVNDLGLEVAGPDAAANTAFEGIYLPPEAIFVLPQDNSGKRQDLIVIKGRVQYRSSVQGGEVLLIRSNFAASAKGQSLGRSTFLTIKGAKIELSTSNEVAFAVRSEQISWMTE